MCKGVYKRWVLHPPLNMTYVNGQPVRDDNREVFVAITSTLDRQYNGQKKKNKRTNNALYYITQKIKDRAT
jgi:hypothetical protein